MHAEELHSRSTRPQRAEEQRRSAHAEGMILADQRDGDAVETIGSTHRGGKLVFRPQDPDCACGTGERARQDHRLIHPPAYVDARRASRFHPQPYGARFKSVAGALEPKPDAQGGDEREHKASVQPREASEDPRKLRRSEDFIGARARQIARGGCPQWANHEPVFDEADRHPVQHDGGDHLVHPAPKLEHRRQEGVQRASAGSSHYRKNWMNPWWCVQLGADHRRDNGAHRHLALGADVEQAHAKRHRDGKAGKGEQRRLRRGLAPRTRQERPIAGCEKGRQISQPAPEHLQIGIRRHREIRLAQRDGEEADEKSKRDRQQRRQRLAREQSER